MTTGGTPISGNLHIIIWYLHVSGVDPPQKLGPFYSQQNDAKTINNSKHGLPEIFSHGVRWSKPWISACSDCAMGQFPSSKITGKNQHLLLLNYHWISTTRSEWSFLWKIPPSHHPNFSRIFRFSLTKTNHFEVPPIYGTPQILLPTSCASAKASARVEKSTANLQIKGFGNGKSSGIYGNMGGFINGI